MKTSFYIKRKGRHTTAFSLIYIPPCSRESRFARFTLQGGAVSLWLYCTAPLIEKSSNSFKSDLLKINELKPLFDEWWAKRGSTDGKDPG